ncbi:TIR domain-containing protein [Erwinia tracheiphila]|uniref:TIR domain-containing protein n=1 Tax=Erwinia tracheiphila TaxID=65700 RepID=UPI003AAEE360
MQGEGDKDAIQKLHDWNDSKHLSLSFTDAHDLTQARDGSLNCSIKSSLNTRSNVSKTFVLIVGSNTKTARSGRCQYCARGHSIDNKIYIEYECNRAVVDKLKIVVLYNAVSVDKSKCSDVIKNSVVTQTC